MKNFFIILVFFTFALSSNTYSQRLIVKALVDALGRNARVYFLSANRPSYGVSTYTTGKGNFELSTGISVGDGFIEFPLDLQYGLSDKIDLIAQSTPFTQSYTFDGEKVSGFGDIGAGVRYKFQRSENFEHSFESIIKIPTASKSNELGTGRVDFHFGLGHSYFSAVWGYDIGLEFNLLHRRDLPGLNVRVPEILRNQIDSIKKVYDYKYEPDLGFSVSPAFYPGGRTYIYSGFAFMRNTKLDYNSSSIFGGVGYAPSNALSLSLGGSYGLNDGGSWLISFGLNFAIIRKMY